MIRKANTFDLEGVLSVLQSVGTNIKDPLQGFLMADYTQNVAMYREQYAKYLKELKYKYVLEEDGKIKAFLLCYTKDEWLQEVPNWDKEIYWHPEFPSDGLDKFVLINQTAMYPELTGKGLGSRLYKALENDLRCDGIKYIMAETIVAPVPNFASLNFRIKQKYNFAGVRYEKYKEVMYSTLIYYRLV